MALSSSRKTIDLAEDVHSSPPAGVSAALPPLRNSMDRDFQTRFTAVFLVLLTAGAITLAAINFRKASEYAAPYDGISWMEHGQNLVADRVDAGSPGTRAGIKIGDRLLAVDGRPVSRTGAVTQQLYHDGVWSKATYSLIRGAVPLDASVILVPAERNASDWLRLVALVYLGIGLYVLFRRWTAPGSTHFYIFCLASFVFHAFHFSGKLNPFDWTIYWANDVAWLLQPAIFLHFVLTFPEEHDLLRRHRWAIPALYLPGAVLLAFHLLALNFSRASERLDSQINRLYMGYLVAYFVTAALVFLRSYREADRTILRQQLKWVTRGTILAITPFTLIYAVPSLLGYVPTDAMKLSVLSLGILPLTFGYAIFRYRLMDVDLIFKRGMVSTLAAAAIVGTYFAVVAGIAELVHLQVPNSGSVGLVLAMVVTALLFDPVRKWIQEHIDQFFYRTRYDYRKTLIEFGRELNAETDLDKMLSSVVDRLSRTLLVDRMALCLATSEGPQKFLLAMSIGMT